MHSRWGHNLIAPPPPEGRERASQPLFVSRLSSTPSLFIHPWFMTLSPRQTISCCLPTYSSLAHQALIKNGSQLQLVSSLSLSLSFSASRRSNWEPLFIGPPTKSHPRLIHLIGMATDIFLFLLPGLFHIIHRYDVGIDRFHGMLFIRHPVSVTLRSSIPYTFSGHKPQNKGSLSPSLSSLNTSASRCGSTFTRSPSRDRRPGYTGCRRPVGLVKRIS